MLKILTLKNTYDDVNIRSPVTYLCIVLELGNKVYHWIHTETLELIHIVCACEFSHSGVIFFTPAAPFCFR